MNAPLRRRRDPEPIGRGWEIAFVVVTTMVGCIVCAALVGVGVAAAMWGDGWVWPPAARDIGPVVVGLLEGQPQAGYPDPLAARLAAPLPTCVVVVLAEIVLTIVGLVLARQLRERLGLGHSSGFATRAQAQQALGVGALRAAQLVIRPDLIRRR